LCGTLESAHPKGGPGAPSVIPRPCAHNTVAGGESRSKGPGGVLAETKKLPGGAAGGGRGEQLAMADRQGDALGKPGAPPLQLAQGIRFPFRIRDTPREAGALPRPPAHGSGGAGKMGPANTAPGGAARGGGGGNAVGGHGAIDCSGDCRRLNHDLGSSRSTSGERGIQKAFSAAERKGFGARPVSVKFTGRMPLASGMEFLEDQSHLVGRGGRGEAPCLWDLIEVRGDRGWAVGRSFLGRGGRCRRPPPENPGFGPNWWWWENWRPPSRGVFPRCTRRGAARPRFHGGERGGGGPLGGTFL